MFRRTFVPALLAVVTLLAACGDEPGPMESREPARAPTMPESL